MAIHLSRKLINLAMLTAVVGCSTYPKLPGEDFVKIADVLNTVECDLRDAVKQYENDYPWLKDWAAAVVLELKVEEKGEGNGDASIVVPITNGTVTVGLVAGLTQKATHKATIDTALNFDFLSCPSEEGRVVLRIDGGFGIPEWLSRAASALEIVKEDPTKMSYTRQFSITVNGSVNPKFGIQKVDGHQYGGGLKIGGTRLSEHTLTVTAKKRAADDLAKRNRLGSSRKVRPSTLRDLEDAQTQTFIRNIEM